MNECHTNFASSNKSMFQICFECTILLCGMYELWMNEFCTIFITKVWDANFVMGQGKIKVLLKDIDLAKKN